MVTEWIFFASLQVHKSLINLRRIFRSKFFFTASLFLASILLLFSKSMIFAQDIECSDLIKFNREMKNMAVIASDAEGFYVADENKKEQFVRLSKFGFDGLKQTWTTNISIASTPHDQQYEKLQFFGDKFMLFTSRFNQVSEQYQIFCSFFDLNGKKLTDPALVHYTLIEGRSSAPAFELIISPDSSKMLLYFDPPGERKMTEALSFKCYDIELDMLWEKEIKLPYSADMVQVHSFLLDNKANVYMMSGRNPSKSGSLWQKAQGGRYVVFFFSASENKLKEYDVSLKDKQVMSVKFDLNKEQEVIIAGYYSNDFRFSAAGTFLFAIDSFGAAVKSASFMPFPKEFLLKLLKKTKSDSEAALPDFYLDHLIIHDDGNILLIGEQYYATENIALDPATGRQLIEYRFNFDDIIVTSLDRNGRHTWNAKIPKRQFTVSDTKVCSYQCFKTATGLSFYFNDHSENQQKLSALEDEEPTLWSGSKSGVTTRATVAMDGSQKRETLFSNKEKDALLNTYYGLKDTGGPHLLGYEDGKSYKYCLVK